MEKYGLTFHHIGLAVAKPAAASAFLKGIGYKIGDTVYDPQQNVNLIMCEGAAMPDIEVIYPAGNGEPGPLDNMLPEIKTKGIFYHLCYETADAAASIGAIQADGHKVFPLSELKPAVLFGGDSVGFYLVKGFGMIELIERK